MRESSDSASFTNRLPLPTRYSQWRSGSETRRPTPITRTPSSVPTAHLRRGASRARYVFAVVLSPARGDQYAPYHSKLVNVSVRDPTYVLDSYSTFDGPADKTPLAIVCHSSVHFQTCPIAIRAGLLLYWMLAKIYCLTRRMT